MDEILFSLMQSQLRVWTTQMMYPESAMFNIGGTVSILGRIDVNILRKSIQLLVCENDAFHIRLKEENGVPVQYFVSENDDEIEYIDFSGVSELVYSDWVENEARKIFDMLHSKLYKFIVYKLNEDKYGYFIKIHHIISDGWSMQLLTNRINEIYGLICSGSYVCDNRHLYELAIESSFSYLNSKRFVKDKAYWNEKFGMIPENIINNSISTSGIRETFYLSKDLSNRIRKYCKKNSISMNSLFIFCYMLYLAKKSGKDDIIIGTPILGRSGSKKEKTTIGMFVNSIPARYVFNHDMSLFDTLVDMDKKIKESYRYHKYPYNYMVNDMGGTPLFNTCINYYGTTMCDNFQGNVVINKEFYNKEQEYALQVIVREWENDIRIQLDIDYKLDLYKKADIKDTFLRITIILNKLLDSGELLFKNVDLLTSSEKRLLLCDYNEVEQDVEISRSVVELFEAAVIQFPNRIAIKDKNRQLSYSELAYKVSRLAAYLRYTGVKRNTVVCIYADHAIETVICILGVLMVGGTYLPMEFSCPTERLEYILEDSSVEYMLTNTTMENLQNIKLPKNILFMDSSDLYDNDLPDSGDIVNIESVAYIIYTSGSTGRPKGVAVSHRSLANYILWAGKQYVSFDYEVFPLYSSLAFDLTVTSIFTPLITGSMIKVYQENEKLYVLDQILDDNESTIIKVTPAHLNLFRASSNLKIKKIIVGGEQLTVNLANKIYRYLGKGVRIFNEYGPTEATVGCMIYEYDPVKDIEGAVPIGKPINNTKLHVLDENHNPVPIGWKGELYIAGKALALGYVNQPELTFQKFIVDRRYGLIYKTGDRVKFISEDTIEYIERIDKQVKINGYRVEINEIVACMEAIDEVDKAVVVPAKTKKGAILYAYYTGINVNADTLRAMLHERLPKYMIPAIYTHLDEFPLTTNGKIDVYGLANSETIKNIKPEKKMSNELCLLIDVVEKVMDILINEHDNFYRVGGDSVSAIQISSMLRNLGFILKIKDILEHPDFGEMVEYILSGNDNGSSENICSGEIKSTPMSQWYLEKIHPHRFYFCHIIPLKMCGTYEIEWLNDMLNMLIMHHDSLRLRYNEDEKTFYYGDYIKELLIDDYDISGLSADKQDEVINDKRYELAGLVDITKDTTVRSMCFKLSNEKVIWLIAIHHIAIDGISWRILLNDLRSIFERKDNEKVKFTKKTCSVQQWAEYVHVNSTDYDNKVDYWNRVLNKTNISSGKEVSLNQKLLYLDFDKDTTDKLKNKINDIFNTKFQEIIVAMITSSACRVLKRDSVIIEIEENGRNTFFDEIDISGTVGWFTSMYPVELRCNNDMIEQIKLTKETLRKVPDNGISYCFCQKLDNKWKNEAGWIRFNYLGEINEKYGEFELMADTIFENTLFSPITSMIEMVSAIIKGTLRCCFRYSEDMISSAIVASVINGFAKNVKDIIASCENVNDIYMTPSDFDCIELTQDDLDSLFE